MPKVSQLLLGFLLLAFLSNPLLAEFIDEDPSEVLHRELMQHRMREAETKEIAAKRLLELEADRSFNQEQFDVQHYDLDIDLNPDTHVLSGTLTSTLQVIGDPISTVEFNLKYNMSVSGAMIGAAATTWSHASSMLTIDLDRVYNNGETLTLSVDYSGNPSGGAFGWDSYGGQDMIWTLSEPYGAREWWPCKDLNTDKADSMDIRVTVPDNLIVASNGLLISDVDNGTTRTFHWKTHYPIVTYLVSLAIHPYTVYSDWYTPLAGGDPMEVAFYIFPDWVGGVEENYSKTVPMLEVFAQGFGEYPFVEEKYGMASFTWGGGMEHQTITSMGGWWEDVVSHEAGHQWWGDYITCDDFSHIWLNEGFATWCEAYWKEQTEGFSVYQDYMDGAAYMGAGTIFVEDPYNDNIFDGNLSYNKGSWIPHMLRGMMGDEDFFAGLTLYQDIYGHDSATTEEFRDVMEAASGLELDQFFTQWIYGEYFPVYEYNWSVTRDGIVTLDVDQVQTNTGLFTMPIRIRVNTDQGAEEFTVQNSMASESYELAVTGTVESVLLDPDKWILRQVRTTVSNPTFDAGILLVNGVDWGTYDPEIQNAYEAKAFWGENVIDFWDTFSEPSGGYPSTLPAPVGHGAVTADVISAYSTVIWVGNHYNGDLADWQETPIASYLEVGGNVILMSRRGSSFLGDDLTDHLGITWAETEESLGNCMSNYLGLVNIAFTGSQSWNDVFSTSVGPNSTLLFKDTSGFSVDRGTGVHAQPPGGGTHRPEGGQMVFLSGRPYRMDHASLRSNVEYILENFFGEPWNPTSVGDDQASTVPMLKGNFPNPFNPKTEISFSLPDAGSAELAVYDTAGRLVRVLVSGHMEAGEHNSAWDGRDDTGAEVASGVYFASLKAAGLSMNRKMVLLK
ncbi:T9SS type A sorting domain-containing protein [bacterium]|nr:T9SS type A sorting domain-containing protein [bacterium]